MSYWLAQSYIKLILKAVIPVFAGINVKNKIGFIQIQLVLARTRQPDKSQIEIGKALKILKTYPWV